MEGSVVWIQTMASLPYWPAYIFNPEELPEDQIGLKKSLVMLNKRQSETSPNRKYAVYMYGSGLYDFVKASQILSYVDKRDDLVNQVVSDSFTNLFNQAISVADKEITLAIEYRLSWVIRKNNTIQPSSPPLSLSSISKQSLPSTTLTSSSSTLSKVPLSSSSLSPLYNIQPLESSSNSNTNNIKKEITKVIENDFNKDEINDISNDIKIDNALNNIDNSNNIITTRSIRRNRQCSTSDVQVTNVERKEIPSSTNTIMERKYSNDSSTSYSSNNNIMDSVCRVSNNLESHSPGIDSISRDIPTSNRVNSFEVNNNNINNIINFNVNNSIDNLNNVHINKDVKHDNVNFNKDVELLNNNNNNNNNAKIQAKHNEFKESCYLTTRSTTSESTEIHVDNEKLIQQKNQQKSQQKLNYGRPACPSVAFGFGGKLAVFIPESISSLNKSLINTKINVFTTIGLVEDYVSKVDMNVGNFFNLLYLFIFYYIYLYFINFI
jgi:hypothetical protein